LGVEIGAKNATPEAFTVTKPPEPMEEELGESQNCSASKEEEVNTKFSLRVSLNILVIYFENLISVLIRHRNRIILFSGYKAAALNLLAYRP
jgi:hypothetical protein